MVRYKLCILLLITTINRCAFSESSLGIPSIHEGGGENLRKQDTVGETWVPYLRRKKNTLSGEVCFKVSRKYNILCLNHLTNDRKRKSGASDKCFYNIL